MSLCLLLNALIHTVNVQQIFSYHWEKLWKSTDSPEELWYLFESYQQCVLSLRESLESLNQLCSHCYEIATYVCMVPAGVQLKTLNCGCFGFFINNIVANKCLSIASNYFPNWIHKAEIIAAHVWGTGVNPVIQWVSVAGITKVSLSK